MLEFCTYQFLCMAEIYKGPQTEHARKEVETEPMFSSGLRFGAYYPEETLSNTTIESWKVRKTRDGVLSDTHLTAVAISTLVGIDNRTVASERESVLYM